MVTSCGVQVSLTTSKSQYQVESRFLLDVVVWKGSTIFKLFTGKDKSLLIGRNTFLVLDLSLDILDSVAWLNI